MLRQMQLLNCGIFVNFLNVKEIVFVCAVMM